MYSITIAYVDDNIEYSIALELYIIESIVTIYG